MLTGDAQPKSGILASDQELATIWLSTGSTSGLAYKPYLVKFKGGTAISFYKDGKVQSGTLAQRQNLIKSLPQGGGHPNFISVNADTVVQFNKDGYVTGL